MRKAAGIFAIVIGIAIIGLWIMLLTTGQVSEFETEPAGIMTHIIAEMLMAILLLISGIGLVRKSKSALMMFVLASGLLIYSVINSSGYYIDNANMVMVIFFAAILVVTVFLLIRTKALKDGHDK